MQLIPQVREALGLLEKKKIRDKAGKFVVEGEHLVLEALKDAEYVIYSAESPAVRAAASSRISSFKVSRKLFSLLTSVETPQGVLAVVKKREWNLEDVIRSAGTIIFCAGIQDPGNLGTVIRSADAVGAAGVIVSRGTVDPFNQKTIRSTMGSLFHLPLVQIDDEEESIRALKKRGIKVIGADMSGKDYWGAELSGPVTVLIGNEGAGLQDKVLAACDEVVKIPMPGRAESLNAAMSASLIMYETLRQKWSKESKL